ncbi:Rrf2 family transcriptional regulator [Paenibacillus kyungheensis]
MKFSKATNYALHTMVYLVQNEVNKSLGVQQIAETFSVSPTYLSKILTKLVKAGLIESASGANGGYRLKRKGEDISFLEVIHAIEGVNSLFTGCLNNNPQCAIQQVMIEAEGQMEEYLKNKKLIDVSIKSEIMASHSS